MTGIVDTTGAKSGQIGTISRVAGDVTLTGTQTLTNKTFVAPALGTVVSGTLGAGSILNGARLTDLKSSDGSVTAMTTDTTGRISQPAQPFFYVYGDNTGDGWGSSVFTYMTTTKNVGGHLSNTLSRFTCPVNGVYFFSGFPAYKQTGNTYILQFYVNGSERTVASRWLTSAQESHSGQNFSINLWLAANDYVEIFNAGGATHRNTTINYWSGGLQWAAA